MPYKNIAKLTIIAEELKTDIKNLLQLGIEDVIKIYLEVPDNILYIGSNGKYNVTRQIKDKIIEQANGFWEFRNPKHCLGKLRRNKTLTDETFISLKPTKLAEKYGCGAHYIIFSDLNEKITLDDLYICSDDKTKINNLLKHKSTILTGASSTDIQTLTIDQLLKRWNNSFSENDIYELANKGYFGLYFKPCVKKQTHCNIEKSIERLVTAKNISDAERKNYLNTKKSFLAFIKKYGFLLEEKKGYERLATKTETEIYLLCETGSINCLIKVNKITFHSFNNTFGFVKKNDEYIANSYYLLVESTITHQPPPYYKGYLAKDDLFIFTDQIANFENSGLLQDLYLKKHGCEALDSLLKGQVIKQSNHNTNVSFPKKISYKTKREKTTLEKLCKTEYKQISNDKKKHITAKEMWLHLTELVNNDFHAILLEVDNWDIGDKAKITYKKSRNTGKAELQIGRRRFENIISKIRTS